MATPSLPARPSETNSVWVSERGHRLLHSRRIKILAEATLGLVLAVTAFDAVHRYRIFRGVASWILRREDSLADEVFVAFIVLTALGLIFTIRRLRDLAREVAARRKAQASLQSLHAELEQRVQT